MRRCALPSGAGDIGAGRIKVQHLALRLRAGAPDLNELIAHNDSLLTDLASYVEAAALHEDQVCAQVSCP